MILTSYKEMKNKLLVFLLLFAVIPNRIYAARGCCSSHGGVAGCDKNGRSICADGSLSPTCTCTPPVIYGCTDSRAKNYDTNANTNDGSCQYYVYGCTDNMAKNYNPEAERDDGSCQQYVYGCTDNAAINYNEKAEIDDDSCTYAIQENDSNGSALGPLAIIGATGAIIAYKKNKKGNKKK